MIIGNDYHNAIHAVLRVPGTEAEIQRFVPNWTAAAGSKSIMSELLPKAFCRKLKDFQIQMNFMDMSPAFKNDGEVSYWENEGSNPMAKIAHFLGGKITAFTHISRCIPLGLPSYADLIKILIMESSQSQKLTTSHPTVLDESQKTLLKLNGSMNGSTRANDDTDVESIRSNGFRIANPSYALALSKHQRRSFPESLQHRFQVVEDHNQRWSEFAVESGGGRQTRRFSDEREQPRRHSKFPSHDHHNHHEEIPRKRKYEFEEDMESEEGYSPTDIQNWCIKGNVGIKERPPKPQRPAPAQQVRDMRGLNQKQYSSQHLQPQKRIRRDHEEMAPPSRTYSVKRYSDPTLTTSRINTSTLKTRGHVMVNKGLQKKPITKKREKPNPDEDVDFPPKTNFWKTNERTLQALKNRLQMILDTSRTRNDLAEKDPITELNVKVNWFIDMLIREEDCCLPSAAQALVTMVGASLVDLHVRDLRDAMERILFIPFDNLNMSVIKLKDTSDGDAIFQSCRLQILINFEMFWTVPSKNTSVQEERFIEDVTRILHLVRVFKKEKDPSIEEFLTDTLVPL